MGRPKGSDFVFFSERIAAVGFPEISIRYLGGLAAEVTRNARLSLAIHEANTSIHAPQAQFTPPVAAIHPSLTAAQRATSLFAFSE